VITPSPPDSPTIRARPPVPEFCRRIVSAGAAGFASGASHRRTPRHRSPGTPPASEEPAPPEPLRLRPARQLNADRARRLPTAWHRRFLRVSGSVSLTTRTERQIHPIVPRIPARSNTHEKQGETPSAHECAADPLGSGHLGSSDASASTGEPVSSPALVQQPPPRAGRNCRTDHWACRS
jgi:hypothetical protein